MHIIVLFGGHSAERDVSIASATGIVRALRSRGHHVSAFDLAHGVVSEADEGRVLRDDVPTELPHDHEMPQTAGSVGALLGTMREHLLRCDLVFLALHGGIGEDGTIQAYLSLLGVPFTGASATGSALAMDKELSKRLFRDAGIATPRWLYNPTSVERVIAELGSHVVVKPNAQGSTVGLTVARDIDEIQTGLELASRYGDVLVEQFIAGRELTIGVLGNTPLVLGEIVLPTDSPFSYEEKYQRGAVKEVFPAQVSPIIADDAKRIATLAHHTLKLTGFSRSDFRLDRHGKLWLVEVNTLPGMTSTSLLPQSAAACGIDYADLCERICAAALEAAAPQSNHVEATPLR